MLTTIIALAVGNLVPFAVGQTQVNIRLGRGNGLHSAEIADAWKDVILTDDGLSALQTRGRYRWCSLADGKWSDPANVYYDSKKCTIGATGDTVARHDPVRRNTVNWTVGALPSKAAILLSNTTVDLEPVRYASLLHFGDTASPIGRVNTLSKGLPIEHILAGRNLPNAWQFLTVQDTDGGLEFDQINLSLKGGSIKARSVGRFKAKYPKGAIARPFASSPNMDRVVTSAFDWKSKRLLIEEYSTAEQKWTYFPLPAGFEHYLGLCSGTVTGLFYWKDRLFFSPLHPDQNPYRTASRHADLEGGIPGLYEVSSDRSHWTRVADCQVLTTSSDKSKWLVRDLKSKQLWLEKL